MSTVGLRWYRVPVLWLGACILIASLLGCISLVMLAGREPVHTLPSSAPQVLKVPASNGAAARP